MRFRKPMRRTVRKADPVTSEVRAFVLARDRMCIAAKLEPGHVCRDMFGYPHAPTDLGRMTLEHVKDQLRAGRRAPSDPVHLLTLCYGTNVNVPSKELRAGFRAYLREVDEAIEDPHAAHVDPVAGCGACYAMVPR